MVSKELKISWDSLALKQLEAACNYIMKDSVKNAFKVQSDIFSSVDSLVFFPEKHPLDKYKRDNDGTYRAFEQHHYRIVYRVLRTRIKIITVRHVRMEPKPY